MPKCPYCNHEMKIVSKRNVVSPSTKKTVFRYVCHNCYARGPVADSELECKVKTLSPAIKEEMIKIAKDKNFEISENMEKIIKAKIRMFGENDWKKCPCCVGDDDRYCGSEQCELDTYRENHCHCNLFLFKEQK